MILLPFLFLLLTTSGAPAKSDVEVTLTPEAVIQLTNQERFAKKRPLLAVSDRLTRAAHAKASDMLRKQYFRHAKWEMFIRQSGYSYCLAGENLGFAQTSAAEVVQDWMNSPSHRANVLKDKYREIGVAVVRGRYKGVEDVTIIVQMFGSKCGP